VCKTWLLWARSKELQQDCFKGNNEPPIEVPNHTNDNTSASSEGPSDVMAHGEWMVVK